MFQAFWKQWDFQARLWRFQSAWDAVVEISKPFVCSGAIFDQKGTSGRLLKYLAKLDYQPWKSGNRIDYRMKYKTPRSVIIPKFLQKVLNRDDDGGQTLIHPLSWGLVGSSQWIIGFGSILLRLPETTTLTTNTITERKFIEIK